MRGFTLIELLFFIAVIGLLSSVALGGIMESRTELRDAKRISEIAEVGRALLAYKNDHESYPASLTALVFASYLGSVPLDPVTGREPFYQVREDGASLGVDLETSHSVLREDADSSSAGFSGGDGRGCYSAPARSCYDIFFPL